MTNLPAVSKTRRAIATLIDFVVIVLILAPIFVVQHFLGIKLIGEAWLLGTPNADPETAGKIMGFAWCIISGYLVAAWIYFVQMETSRYCDTLGKMVAGLQVVNFAGEPISSLRATIRFIFSGLRVLLIYLPLSITVMMLGFILWDPLPDSCLDISLAVVFGGSFIWIVFHSGKRGQRLQDFFSRTRVVRRGWHPDNSSIQGGGHPVSKR